MLPQYSQQNQQQILNDEPTVIANHRYHDYQFGDDADGAIFLPREVILKIFSYLDAKSLYQCAQVSKYWNQVALDKENWREVRMIRASGQVVENLSRKSGNFLKVLELKECRSVSDKSMQTLIVNCRNLEKIDLSGCKQLSDSTFKMIGVYCDKLTHLDLVSCCIYGTGLTEIAKGCRQLKHINISKNTCIRYGIETLAENCTNLISFVAYNCFKRVINDDSVVALTRHRPKLQKLVLNGSRGISNESLKSIGENCHELTHLELREFETFLSGDGLIAVGEGCTLLQQIDLMGCHLIRAANIVFLVENLSNLVSFSVSHCNEDVDYPYLMALSRNCRKIQRIKLQYCRPLLDTSLRSIGENCHELTSLDICSCSIARSTFGIFKFEGCKALKQVSILNCKGLQRFDIRDIIENHTNLVSFSASHTEAINFAGIGENCHKLKDVHFGSISGFLGPALISIGANCHELINLEVSSCNITDEDLAPIAEGCKLLRHVDISYCQRIQTAGIIILAKNCTNLHSFAAQGCGPVTINDESLRALGQNCHMLEEIDLRRCAGISELGIKWLSDNCPRLRVHYPYEL